MDKRFNAVEIKSQPIEYINPTHFKFYGQYGGPNYSAGKYDASIDELIRGKTIDKLDELTKEHDMYYSLGRAKQGDDVLISNTSKLFSVPDIIHFLLHPAESASKVLSGKHMKESAIALNLGFRGKRLIEKHALKINQPKKNKTITKDEKRRLEKELFIRQLKHNTTSEETT